MRKKVIISFIGFLLFVIPQYLFAAAPTEDQFTVYRQAPGIQLFKYNSDYVMEVDLTIARIKSIHNPQEGSISACTTERSKTIAPRSIADHWEDAKKESNALAVFNFGFFGGYNLALPLKVGNNVISYGYNLVTNGPGGIYPGEYKYVRFNNDTDRIFIGRLNCDETYQVCFIDD
jgi:hypothetical protein